MDAFSRSQARSTARPWLRRLAIHLAWFVAATLFVAILLATYGLDLSPGFF